MDGPPTRSRIEAFDQTADVLTELAERLRAGSPRLKQAADVYLTQVNAPNGTVWQGNSAKRFSEEAHPDQESVARAIEHAAAMADIAERGGDYLRGARESAVEAITRAEEEEFAVGEDLSVVDKYAWESPIDQAARQQAAVAHRNFIAHWAARLQAANVNIAAQLNAGASETAALTPPHWRQPNLGYGQPVPHDRDTSTTSDRKGKVQSFGHGWKQDPSPRPEPPISREQAQAGLRDVNQRIWEHNHIDKPVIEKLPPNDPRRTDFHRETIDLNTEKQQYLDVLFHQHPPESVVGPHGERLPGVPPGETAIGPADSGKGWLFPIQPGQPGIDPRVVSVRMMEPTPECPNGYVVYMNAQGQTVNPFTGRTIPRWDDYAHIPLPE